MLGKHGGGTRLGKGGPQEHVVAAQLGNGFFGGLAGVGAPTCR